MMYGRCALSDRSVSWWAEQIEADGAEHAAADDGGPRAAAVQDAPADLGRDDEADEEVQDVDAGVGRGLAQRHLGVHAGEEEERDEDR